MDPHNLIFSSSFYHYILFISRLPIMPLKIQTVKNRDNSIKNHLTYNKEKIEKEKIEKERSDQEHRRFEE